MQKMRYTPLILVMALLVNAVLPFALVFPSAQHVKAPSYSLAFGEKILLCTAEGLKWVKLADLRSGKEKPKPHSSDQCPLCSAVRHGVKDIILSAADIPLSSHRVTDHVVPFYTPSLVELLPITSLNARAPPLPFIG